MPLQEYRSLLLPVDQLDRLIADYGPKGLVNDDVLHDALVAARDVDQSAAQVARLAELLDLDTKRPALQAIVEAVEARRHEAAATCSRGLNAALDELRRFRLAASAALNIEGDPSTTECIQALIKVTGQWPSASNIRAEQGRDGETVMIRGDESAFVASIEDEQTGAEGRTINGIPHPLVSELDWIKLVERWQYSTGSASPEHAAKTREALAWVLGRPDTTSVRDLVSEAMGKPEGTWVDAPLWRSALFSTREAIKRAGLGDENGMGISAAEAIDELARLLERSTATAEKLRESRVEERHTEEQRRKTDVFTFSTRAEVLSRRIPADNRSGALGDLIVLTWSVICEEVQPERGDTVFAGGKPYVVEGPGCATRFEDLSDIPF